YTGTGGTTAHYATYPDIFTWTESNYVADASGRVIAGCVVPAESTTITTDTGPGSDLDFPVMDATIFSPGAYVRIGTTARPYQMGTVHTVGTGSINIYGVVSRTYPVGDPIIVMRRAVTRTDATGSSVRISQYFPGSVTQVAVNLVAPRSIACIVS